jgi:hypothetical protein
MDAGGDELMRSTYEWLAQSVAYSHDGATWLLQRAERLLAHAVAWDDLLSVLYLGHE